eukprot:4372383-Pleurochrysis_carterae.AAC.3
MGCCAASSTMEAALKRVPPAVCAALVACAAPHGDARCDVGLPMPSPLRRRRSRHKRLLEPTRVIYYRVISPPSWLDVPRLGSRNHPDWLGPGGEDSSPAARIQAPRDWWGSICCLDRCHSPHPRL